MRQLSISKPVGGGGEIHLAAPALRVERVLVVGGGSSIAVAYSFDSGAPADDDYPASGPASDVATIHVETVPCEWPDGDWVLLDVVAIASLAMGMGDSSFIPKRYVAVFVDGPR